jgi:hypothetical protein
MAKNQPAGIKTVDLPENGGLSAYVLMRGAGIAEELREERNRLYCLATSIVNRLTPEENRDSPDPIALGLAEVLEEMLGDCRQEEQLVELLSTTPTDAVPALSEG